LKKIICFFILSLNIATTAIAQVPIIGSIGLAIGQITNQKNEVLKAGDNVYFGDIIKADSKSKSQVLLLDETVITLGEQTTIIMDEFIYDPNKQNGKIISTVLKGSVKVLSGKISRGNPEDLVIKTPAGSIGTRGTEFQTIVDENEDTSQVLLIGPGENNSLGLRPGAVEVSNELGSVVLDTPFSFTQFSTTTIPSPPIAITNEQLEQFQNFLDIRATVIETETVEEAIKSSLFSNDQITGNDLIGDIVIAALDLSDGGLTFDQIAEVLGTTTEQLLGDTYQEIQNETPENQIAMANAEGGDGLAYILKYGGTNLGQTTYGDFQGIASGTYTYTGNNINMAATEGTGSGTFSGVTTVNFATKNIANTFNGTLQLAGNSDVDFQYSFNHDYSGGSASSALEGNKANFGINRSNGTTTAEPAGGDASFDPRDYTQAGGKYYANGQTAFFNVQMNGSPNPSTGSVATIALNVYKYNDDADASDNTIDGQRGGIMPKRN